MKQITRRLIMLIISSYGLRSKYEELFPHSSRAPTGARAKKIDKAGGSVILAACPF